ncbi:exocyst complex component EXO70B1 [Magnolia sinica]|uniref:exocyst complex component EXO70B1 n=1 Tax=Magnolia sinica TaxID=86752 RepID=UPI002657D93F|nr:exocyst complex component EXO70B1 [Magnolia sinica]
MAENGEDKLIAVARHIAKTLGRTETMTDDILQIFSAFDGRFSRDKLSDKLSDDDSLSLDQTLKSLDRRIKSFVSSDRPIWSDAADSTAFLETVDELLATIREWDPMAAEKPIAACLDRADELLQQAMFRLEDEFRAVIEQSGESTFDPDRRKNSYSFDSGEDDDDDVDGVNNNGGDDSLIPVAHPVADYDIVIDAMPAVAISDLHEIAKRMVAAGFGKECSHVYSSYRREFLEESLSRLGLQKRSIEEVQKMAWADLEDEIERWIRAANVSLRILFPSERRLCDRVFAGLPSSVSDLSFMEVSRGAAIQLLNFTDAVAIGTRAPERLFRVLDLFEALRDLMPEFDTIFSDPYCGPLRSEAATILKRLGEAIRGIFMELENLIRRDPAKASVPGGGIHPITRYVMNYLRAACGSRQTLEQVLEENSSPNSNPNPTNVAAAEDIRSSPSTSTSLSIQMAWIMELLESNLEAKSKMYRDPALIAVFLMNNNRYIVQKVRDSELGALLGDDWIRKHTTKVRQLHVSYQRAAWSKVLAVLKLDGGSNGPPLGLKSYKEKFKMFNLYFEENCRAQSEWIVADERLRTELRISVAGNLVPAYRNFIGRFQSVPEVGKHSEKHIGYTVEDVESMINELFRGGSGSGGGRK